MRKKQLNLSHKIFCNPVLRKLGGNNKQVGEWGKWVGEKVWGVNLNRASLRGTKQFLYCTETLLNVKMKELYYFRTGFKP